MHDENANLEGMLHVYMRMCTYVHVHREYIRQTNDTVQNTICSDSQSIENSRR